MVQHFNLDELTASVALLYTSLMAILILRILFRSFRRATNYGIAILGIFLLFSAVCFALRLHKTQFERRTVITSESDEARFEPSDAATLHFTLHEGMALKLLNPNLNGPKLRDGTAKPVG